jgi:hypothetical protein
LVATASVASFAESYRALYDWAAWHGLSGIWAVGWPLQVDSFIAVGELALFVALTDGWQRRSRVAAWLVTLAGLAVSVAGNVGHAAAHTIAARATAAVPPLAAAAALAVGLGVLKRVMASYLVYGATSVPNGSSGPAPGVRAESCQPGTANEHRQDWDTGVPAVPAGLNGHASAATELFAAELAAGEVPSIRRIRAALHCGQPRAREIQAHLAALIPARLRIRDEIHRGTPVPG